MRGFAFRTGLVFDWSGVAHRVERLGTDDQIVLERLSDGQVVLSCRPDLLAAFAALPSALRSALAEIPKQLHFSEGAPKQWVFNPAVGTAQREDSLKSLTAWWRALSPWIEVVENDAHDESARFREMDGIQERICVKLLNEIVAAAGHWAAPEKFQRFARAWPPMPIDADRLPADQLLELLARKLLTVSSAQRCYLFETASAAAEAARAVA